MTSYTVANISRVTAPELYSALIKSEARPITTAEGNSATSNETSTNDQDSSVVIVDVRDSDYIGGHIRGCHNVPLNTLDHKAPELVRIFKDKDMVVFHCMLSQQRGPSAALKYLRERQRMGVQGDQKVVVLDGGFQAWQEEYGLDDSVTEGYRKELWD